MRVNHRADRAIREIWFITSAQPAIDRGWDTADVDARLRTLGFVTKHVDMSSDEQVYSALSGRAASVLAWPVCYTIGGQVDGRLLAAILEELDVAFVGTCARGLVVSSKIALKEALERSTVRTPRYQIVDAETITHIPFQTPYVMKCEYSCDSRGVRVIRSPAEARTVWLTLSDRYGQRIIAEEWRRSREYTVCYIPGAVRPIVGSLEFILAGDRLIVDEAAKCDNRLIRFAGPDRKTNARLASSVCRLAADLKIDGHFRADFLQDASGALYVIDINFLPEMHFSEHCLSYFPMALRATLGMDPEGVVCALLGAAGRKWHLKFPEAAEKRIEDAVRSENAR
jgi:D-alanine-D-alanine ligase-like ATP-grasp enzyme